MDYPGRPVSIYDVGELVETAFPKAMTPTNIVSAFKKCGIFPFDRHLFSDEDYMPSLVTDRSYNASQEEETTRDDDVAMVSAGPSCINDDHDEVEEGIQETQSNSFCTNL